MDQTDVLQCMCAGPCSVENKQHSYMVHEIEYLTALKANNWHELLALGQLSILLSVFYLH